MPCQCCPPADAFTSFFLKSIDVDVGQFLSISLLVNINVNISPIDVIPLLYLQSVEIVFIKKALNELNFLFLMLCCIKAKNFGRIC